MIIPYKRYDSALTICGVISYGFWFLMVGWSIENVGFGDFQFPENIIARIASMIILTAIWMLVGAWLHLKTTGILIDIMWAYLYVINILQTDMSLREAQAIRWLFIPTDTGKWYPCTEVLRLPKAQRKAYLQRVYMQSESDRQNPESTHWM